MFCENYKQPLTDAAASAAELAQPLRAHLHSCVGCRTAFAEEQSLFAAIDADLHSVANAEVPSSLLPDVRAALKEEAMPRPLALSWGFAPAAAAVVVVLAVGMFIFHGEKPKTQETSNIQTQRNFPPKKAETSAPSTIPSSRWLPTKRVEVKSIAPPSIVRSDPEVLVPDEERLALARFLSAQEPPSTQTSTEIALVPKLPQEVLAIPPVEIAKLDLAPLKKEDGQPSEF